MYNIKIKCAMEKLHSHSISDRNDFGIMERYKNQSYQQHTNMQLDSKSQISTATANNTDQTTFKRIHCIHDLQRICISFQDFSFFLFYFLIRTDYGLMIIIWYYRLWKVEHNHSGWMPSSIITPTESTTIVGLFRIMTRHMTTFRC